MEPAPQGVLNYAYIRNIYFCSEEKNKSAVDNLKAFRQYALLNCGISNFHEA